jgi:hypothetical protein
MQTQEMTAPGAVLPIAMILQLARLNFRNPAVTRPWGTPR